MVMAVGLMQMFMMLSHSCGMLGPEEAGSGEIRIAFEDEAMVSTKSSFQIPDTSEFILTVTDSKGKVLYDGKYGDSPESIVASAGSYTVKAVSGTFVRPSFDSPQFGDEQCVVVSAGKAVDVKLVCSQMNSGIRLVVSPSFLDEFPDGVLMLKSEGGSLMYGYSEKRTAFFRPGKVSLVMSKGGTDNVLTSRSLGAGEMLILKVGAVSSSESSRPSGQISIAVDTLRSWITDSYVIGGENGGGKGSASDNALTVSQAAASAGEEDVWVSGYIVGGDLTSSGASFDEPFESRTNIILGPRSSTDSRTSCMSVQLPSGSVRDRLNLVDNPHLLGSKVCLKGDIVESYFGLPGIKNVSEFEMQ